MKQKHVCVCVPARDQVDTMFSFDLVNMICDHVKNTSDGVDLLYSQGTLLCSQRAALVLEARRNNATHILWLDSDMRFPRDTISRLLERDKLVVGANCARRRMPTGPTAANYDAITGKKIPVFTEQHSSGLEAVEALGTGVLMVNMDVYDQIPAPWFATPWIVEHAGYQGEDIYFTRLLKDYGIKVWVDHDLSKEIGHIGQWEYRHEHTWVMRQAKKEEEQAEAAKVCELLVEA